jgi:hypothetical protein
VFCARALPRGAVVCEVSGVGRQLKTQPTPGRTRRFGRRYQVRPTAPRCGGVRGVGRGAPAEDAAHAWPHQALRPPLSGAPYSDAKVANCNAKVRHGVI